MECTNRLCRSKNKEAKILFQGEWKTIKDDHDFHTEYLCEKCAIDALSFLLAYKSQNKFRLIRYIPIEDKDILGID